MNNELTVTEGMSDKEFLATLDTFTGYNQQNENLPIIKFNATNGVWLINKGEKDEDGRYTFTEIGKDITIHPLNFVYKLVNSGDKSPIKVYSKEFSGQNVVLYNQDNREIAEEGMYKDLKEKYDLKYTQIVYASYNNELVRVKLSGFSLTNWFKFLQSKRNAAKYEITFSLGRRMKGINGQECVEASKKEIETYTKDLKEGRKPSLNLFYEYTPVISKELWHTVEDKQLIVERINAVNSFLMAKNLGTLTIIPKEAEVELEQIGSGSEDISSVIPF
jgi:hypothetical protein